MEYEALYKGNGTELTCLLGTKALAAETLSIRLIICKKETMFAGNELI